MVNLLAFFVCLFLHYYILTSYMYVLMRKKLLPKRRLSMMSTKLHAPFQEISQKLKPVQLPYCTPIPIV